MDLTGRRIAAFLIMIWAAVLLLGCGAASSSTEAEVQATPVGEVFLTATPAPVIIEPNPYLTNAQATVAAGQSQLVALSRQATENSLAIAQTENAAALATQQSIQSQQAEQNFEATSISQNIANADATEDFFAQQTRTARDAALAARRAAQAATRTADSVDQTVVAEARSTVAVEVSQTAQAVAVAASFPLTETPVAATQVALVNQEYVREQDNFVNRIVAPLIPVMGTILIILILILVVVLVRRQLVPIPLFQPIPVTGGNHPPDPAVTIEGEMSDYVPRPQPVNPSGLNPENISALPCEKLVYVETVDANEPPINHWVDEVEQQLADEGGPEQ